MPDSWQYMHSLSELILVDQPQALAPPRMEPSVIKTKIILEKTQPEPPKEKSHSNKITGVLLAALFSQHNRIKTCLIVHIKLIMENVHPHQEVYHSKS